MNWYPKDHDPFEKIGVCRIVILKHENMGRSYRGDNLTTIVNAEAMAFGFSAPPKRDGSNVTCPSWLSTEIQESCDHKLNHIFSKHANGLYELYGDVYHWSSRSWEGEWDGDTEIRDYKIQEISFDSAAQLALISDKTYWTEKLDLTYINLHYGKDVDSHEFNYYNNTCWISPYMTRKQILRNHACCLETLIKRGGSVSSYSYDMMPEKQIEDTIHMLMLEADMSKIQEVQIKSVQMDNTVDYVLKRHNDRMVPEESDGSDGKA